MKRTRFLASGVAAGAALAAPRFTLAAGPVTVKIGFLESFSGVFSDIGTVHKTAAQMAIEDVNRATGGRVKFEYVFADDSSKPAVATTEARRLIEKEGVDVLLGGTSSATGAAVSAVSLELGTFNLLIGPQDSSLTGSKATKTTYRFGPNVRMMLPPMLHRTLALGKRWYFIQSDYAFGKDAYAQCSDALKRAGGTEVGHDVVPLGTSDFSSVLTKLGSSGADVLVLCNSGLDAANTVKQWVQFGLNKKMKLAGISMEDIYYKALPLDDIVGATFPVLWSPFASDAARKLHARMSKDVKGPVGGRHYLGYMSAWSLMQRILTTRSTDPEKLISAFENYTFPAAKESKSTYHAFDHQCAQDVYAGSIVSQKKFEKQQFMWDIVGEVPASESDGNAESPWAKQAQAVLATEKIGARSGYTAKTW
jgi:branched-chain amino acid transport system substrate-binding protein